MIEIDTRISFLEKEFNNYYKEVTIVSSSILETCYTNEAVDDEDLQFSKFWTKEYLNKMYHILIVYFETLGLTNYAKDFKEIYADRIKDKNETSKVASILLQYAEIEHDLLILVEWRRILAPFPFFSEQKILKETSKLVGLLKCTNEILKTQSIAVSKEEDINRVIRQMSAYYFSGVMGYTEGYFGQKFTKYRPDVIIKELGTAVEYKLVRKNTDIGTKLDELLIDANAYTGNPTNRHCIAVFCLSTKVTIPEKEILEGWVQKEFPKNWQLLIVKDVFVE